MGIKVTDVELRDALRRADVALFPSREVAGPLSAVALAALASGVPTVLSDCGANAELLRGHAAAAAAAADGDGECAALETDGVSPATRRALPLSSHLDGGAAEATPAVVAQLWAEEALEHLEWVLALLARHD